MTNDTISSLPIKHADNRAASKPGSNVPSLDVEKYLEELAEMEATEVQKIELLKVLWSIMASFVQLGFDMKICGQILESFAEAATSESDAVQSSQSPTLEKPPKKTREEIGS